MNQDFQDVTLAIEDAHTVAAFSAAAGAAVKYTLAAAALKSDALGADGEPYPLPWEQEPSPIKWGPFVT